MGVMWGLIVVTPLTGLGRPEVCAAPLTGPRAREVQSVCRSFDSAF